MLRNKETATAGSSRRGTGHLNVWHILWFGMLSAGLVFCSKQHEAPVAFHETLLGSPSDLQAQVEDGPRVVLTWRMADDANVAGYRRLVVRHYGASQGGPREGDFLRHRGIQFDRGRVCRFDLVFLPGQRGGRLPVPGARCPSRYRVCFLVGSTWGKSDGAAPTIRNTCRCPEAGPAARRHPAACGRRPRHRPVDTRGSVLLPGDLAGRRSGKLNPPPSSS